MRLVGGKIATLTSLYSFVVEENPTSPRAEFPLCLIGQSRVTRSPVAHRRVAGQP